MTEKEQELLKRLLLNLFLENPRRRTQPSQPESQEDGSKPPSTNDNEQKEQHLGGKKHGQKS